MKRLKLISLLIPVLLFSIITAFAQKKVVVAETVHAIGSRTMNTMMVTVGTKVDLVKKSFKKYGDKTLKIKFKKGKKNTLVAGAGDVPTITDKKGDMRALFVQEDNQVKVFVGITFGYEVDLNKEDFPLEYAKLKEWTRRFALYFETEYFTEIMSENTKRMNNLLKTLKSSQKEIGSLTKSIEKLDKNMSKEQDDNKKFDMSNKNIENRSKVQMMHDIISNLRNEILKINGVVDNAKMAIRKLENQTYNIEE